MQLYKDISREECNNLVHVLKVRGAVNYKMSLVGEGAFFLAPSLPLNVQTVVKSSFVVFI